MNITVKKIMYKTDGGRTIFEYYNIPIKNGQRSPFRSDDSRPSFSVYFDTKYNKYKYIDFGEPTKSLKASGDAIDLVKCLFNLSFSDAM